MMEENIQIKEIDFYLYTDSFIFIFPTNALHVVNLLRSIHLQSKSFPLHTIDKDA